jgi:hypothetical protein
MNSSCALSCVYLLFLRGWYVVTKKTDGLVGPALRVGILYSDVSDIAPL